MKKRVLCMAMAFLLCGTTVSSVGAVTEQELMEEQAWTNAQLNATYAYIDEMYAQKQELQNQIAELDEALVTVMVAIDVTKNDIAKKEEDIAKTQKNLERANTAMAEQKETIRERMVYLYENGMDDAWFQMMLKADNLADLLNRAEYTQKMYDNDKKNLELYSNTVTEVQELEAKYASEKAELEEMQASLEQQEAGLQSEIELRKQYSADCDNEIAYAEYLAQEYTNLLYQQQAELERLQAERIAYEQYLREQAAMEAAAEAAAQAEYEAYEDDYEEYDGENGGGGGYDPSEAYSYEIYDGVKTVYNAAGEILESYDVGGSDSASGSYDNGGSSDSGDYDTDYDTDYSGSSSGYEYNVVADTDYDYDSGSSSSGSSSSGSSSSGSAVVDFATQYVGNPYVWGGTSLTNGADCSGFVQSVYSNFGVSLPRTSYEQQNAGYEVSYADAQPGDLICYGGHVAIYMGDGKIVHASNSVDGIKISNDATYRTITSVRRLV